MQVLAGVYEGVSAPSIGVTQGPVFGLELLDLFRNIRAFSYRKEVLA